MKKHFQKHRARKRFGQNFLIDPVVIQQIIAALAPQKDQTIVEIGPGLGALTKALLPIVDKLQAIELDRDLIEHLNRLKHAHKLILYSADALNFNFCTLLQNQQKLRLVGNLPYNIATELLFRLLKYGNCIEDMHFMFQREVAKRLSATVGQKAYGQLSLMMQYYYQVNTLFEVPPEAFRPAPKVYSTFIRFTPHQKFPYVAKNFEWFAKIVKTAFMQRRKTLKNALKNIINMDGELLEKLEISTKARPEEISLEQYVQLSNYS